MFKKLVLHSGIFHGDDVMCAVILKALFPGIRIERVVCVNDEDLSSNDVIVCDIGKVYDPARHIHDHHNDCALIPGTDYKCAAVGLMLNDPIVAKAIEVKFGIDKFNSFLQAIDFILLQRVDNGDTTKEERDNAFISTFVRFSNPDWDSESNRDELFNATVDYLLDKLVIPALMIEEFDYDKFFETLKNQISELEVRRNEAIFRANNYCMDAYTKSNDHRIIVLEKHCPFIGILSRTDAHFAIYPSERTGYMCVPVFSEQSKLSRESFVMKDSLKTTSGLIFANGYTAIFETEAQAVNCAKSLLLA